MPTRHLRMLLIVAWMTMLMPRHQLCAAQGNDFGQTKPLESGELDVPYVPTPQHVVNLMLKLADVKKTDLLYDLGCGDGRIVVAAAKRYGCKAIGVDIDPARVRQARVNVQEAHVEDLVTIEQQDIFNLDLSQADVVSLFLLRSLNLKLIPQLETMKPGSRVVSYSFDMPGVEPDMRVTVSNRTHGAHTIYLWTLPLDTAALAASESDGQTHRRQGQGLLSAVVAYVSHKSPFLVAGMAALLAALVWLLCKGLGGVRINMTIARAPRPGDKTHEV